MTPVQHCELTHQWSCGPYAVTYSVSYLFVPTLCTTSYLLLYDMYEYSIINSTSRRNSTICIHMSFRQASSRLTHVKFYVVVNLKAGCSYVACTPDHNCIQKVTYIVASSRTASSDMIGGNNPQSCNRKDMNYGLVFHHADFSRRFNRVTI